MNNFYQTKNYTEQGGEVTHIGGKLVFDDGAALTGGLIPNQAEATGSGSAVTTLNALIKKLKNCGLMMGDAFSLAYAPVTDSIQGHAKRQENTAKISSVAVDNDTHAITVTLSKKVSELNDFDGGGDWGTHKWLGIGLSWGDAAITGLTYNGTQLTAEDVAEASACGLNTGAFVRWIAADLVLAGDESQKSKSCFTLWADAHQETVYTIRIMEPETEEN